MPEPTAVIPGAPNRSRRWLPKTPMPSCLTCQIQRECACRTTSHPTEWRCWQQTPELATEAEREAFLGCLEHNTGLRLLLTPVLNATGPLSVESSACMRSSYADTDLAALMSSVVGEPGAGPEAEAAMAQGW